MHHITHVHHCVRIDVRLVETLLHRRALRVQLRVHRRHVREQLELRHAPAQTQQLLGAVHIGAHEMPQRARQSLIGGRMDDELNALAQFDGERIGQAEMRLR